MFTSWICTFRFRSEEQITFMEPARSGEGVKQGHIPVGKVAVGSLKAFIELGGWTRVWWALLKPTEVKLWHIHSEGKKACREETHFTNPVFRSHQLCSGEGGTESCWNVNDIVVGNCVLEAQAVLLWKHNEKFAAEHHRRQITPALQALIAARNTSIIWSHNE